jgi:hypothetical protein
VSAGELYLGRGAPTEHIALVEAVGGDDWGLLVSVSARAQETHW